MGGVGVVILGLIWVGRRVIFPPCVCPIIDSVGIPPLKVASVEIVPALVYVPPGEEFEVRARLRTESGRLIDETEVSELRWESFDPARLEVRTRVGHSAVLHTLNEVPVQNVHVKLTAAVPLGAGADLVSRHGTAFVVVTKPSLANVVRVSHSPGASPCALIIDSHDTPQRFDDSVVAFVREMDLGAQRGSAEVFILCEAAEARSTLVNPPSYGASFTAPSGLVGLPVVLWVPDFVVNDGWSPITIAGMARHDATNARTTLARNRTGLRIDVLVKHYTKEDDMDPTCGGAKPGRVAGRINVYYMPSPQGYGPNAMASPKCYIGEPCACPNVEDILIFVSNFGGTTLTHELGHALGIDDIAGFNSFGRKSGNVMATRYSDAADRELLSLGQSFRMNWNALSKVFLVRDANARRACVDEAANAECPSVNLELP